MSKNYLAIRWCCTDMVWHETGLPVVDGSSTYREALSPCGLTAPSLVTGCWCDRHEIAAAHSTTRTLSIHPLQLVHLWNTMILLSVQLHCPQTSNKPINSVCWTYSSRCKKQSRLQLKGFWWDLVRCSVVQVPWHYGTQTHIIDMKYEWTQFVPECT
jgi:hypothetical protein